MRLFIKDFSLYRFAADPVATDVPQDLNLGIDAAPTASAPDAMPDTSPMPDDTQLPEGAEESQNQLVVNEDNEDPVQSLKATLQGILGDDTEAEATDNDKLEQESFNSTDSE